MWAKLQKLQRVHGDELARQVESMGLSQAAKIAALALRERRPAVEGQFAPWQLEVLRQVQSRFCDYAADDLPEPSSIGAFEASAAFMKRFPTSTRQRLADLLTVFELGAALQPGGKRFTKLSPQAQEDYLKRWESSPVPPQRAAFRGLKSICMMGYWSRPQVWPAIDYSIEENPGYPKERS